MIPAIAADTVTPKFVWRLLGSWTSRGRVGDTPTRNDDNHE
jgi:hypothetical protein